MIDEFLLGEFLPGRQGRDAGGSKLVEAQAGSALIDAVHQKGQGHRGQNPAGNFQTALHRNFQSGDRLHIRQNQDAGAAVQTADRVADLQQKAV